MMKGTLAALIAPPARHSAATGNGTPEGLRNFVQAEIDKRTPIMKAASIEAPK